MAEITLKNSQPIPKKPKKRMKGWVIFLIVFFSIIIGLPLIVVAIVYACFFNAGFKDVTAKPGIETSQVFQDAMVDALDYTKSEKKIRVRVTEEMLNQAIYNAMEGFKNTDGYIHNVYVEIDEDCYRFIVQVNVKGFFKTKGILTTKLSINDENIVFKITDVRVGQIGGMSGIFKFVLSKAGITSESLTRSLQETGLRMVADLDKLEIVYPIDNFTEDISAKFVPGDNEQYSAILKEMLCYKDYYSILPNSPESSTNKNYALELALNLDKMKANGDTFGIEGYTMPDGYFFDIADNAREQVITYLDLGAIREKDARTVFKYYVGGFNYLDSSEQSIVYDYLTNDLIDEATDTYNYTVPEEESLEYICKEQIVAQAPKTPAEIHGKRIDVEINTDQIDRMLASSNVLGSPTVMFRQTESGYKLNYVVISRVSTLVTVDPNTGKETFFIVISININGQEVTLALSTDRVATTDFAKMQFKVADMFLGSHKVSEQTKNVFMDLITESIEHGTFDGAVTLESIGGDLYVTMSIEELYKKNSYELIRKEYFDIDYSLSSTTKDNPGVLTFTAISKI